MTWLNTGYGRAVEFRAADPDPVANWHPVWRIGAKWIDRFDPKVEKF